ncbi:50S ribosomal protein L27 [Candidatus Pinguicoccus supinus]|uniref:Large ribosomal subunit protein bL27 n=1 Tax=Candidatus Pinguicoccus supinus TaxID=2529394 RepID=A0A7T0BRN4_9BACT|nr:50S ribosomal protein L27 [Candidatus Pinguicoccus supinus]
MAQKKGQGISKNNRDSVSKHLGLKKYNGQFVKKGSIIFKQRGLKMKSGLNTFVSKDFTIHSKIYGVVKIKSNIISVLNYL